MKILITGVNGFLGSAVLRHLLNADHEARALLRSGSNRDNLTGLELEVMEGDLCDSASLKKEVNSCDHLFHVAADYRL